MEMIAKNGVGEVSYIADTATQNLDEALKRAPAAKQAPSLEAMLQRRSWGVQTSTAQMEIIGRRHYGRKAVPAGGVSADRP